MKHYQLKYLWSTPKTVEQLNFVKLVLAILIIIKHHFPAASPPEKKKINRIRLVCLLSLRKFFVHGDQPHIICLSPRGKGSFTRWFLAQQCVDW